MKKFISFPSIEQFRTIIKDVKHSAEYKGKDEEGNSIYDKNVTYPTLTFKGTVKLHGTNAGVCYNSVDGIWAQSRNNIISVENDNAGFAFFVETNKEVFKKFFNIIINNYNLTDECNISIYGEWCGGNIQKGVGITGLPKMFVIFGLKVSPFDESESAYWLDESFDISVPHGSATALSAASHNIWNINDFKTVYIDIDFNNPAEIQNELIKLTEEVEAECPVAKAFGVSGVGEGIVYTYSGPDGRHVFKVKGEKYSSSKVKTLAEVDVERLNSIKEFVDYAVTENRLNQGVEYVFTQQNIEIDIKHMGSFLKWMMNDIVKEEMDTMVQNGLEPKEISSAVNNAAKKWFMTLIN